MQLSLYADVTSESARVSDVSHMSFLQVT